MNLAIILKLEIATLIVLAMAINTNPARGDPPIVGIANVIDGDTLRINGQRIRLHGIDAPETAQVCEKDGKHYHCGQKATLMLFNKIDRIKISCQKRDTDRYKRTVAVCHLGNVNLNEWMVREGWAIAYRKYSRDYVDDERVARIANVGMWAGRFVKPFKWRRGDRLRTDKDGDLVATSCQIKGNINRSGERIYHVPGGRDYRITKIDVTKGERWFCSEEKAENAGWRRSFK